MSAPALASVVALLAFLLPIVTATSTLRVDKPFAKDYPRSSRKRASSGRLLLAPDGNLRDICSDATGQYLYAAEWPGYIYRSNNYGRSWNVSESINAQWTGIASSSSGQFLAAAIHGGGIYTSADYGVTWNVTTALSDIRWSGITSDGSGQNLAACWGLGNITVSNDGGRSWHNSGAPVDSWMEVVSDLSGAHLYATTFGGYLYRSADSGQTWASVQLLSDFSASSTLATSGDGQVVAVPFYSGPVFVSTDYGVSFDQVTTGNNFWTSVAVDSNVGNQIALTNGLGTVSISTSYGQNWTVLQAPDYPWQTITSSADGQYLAAAFEGSDSIFMSPDFGATWTQYEADSTQYNWIAVVSDAAGEQLASIVYGGYIYGSSDYGSTWTRCTAPYGFWYALAATQNLTTLVAAQNYGAAYRSTDSGATWTTIAALPLAAWSGVAMTGNGSHMAAAVMGGGIWVSGDGGATWARSSAPSSSWTSLSASAASSYFVAVQGGAASNNYSYVYLSADYGRTWQRTNEYSSAWVSVSADATGKDVLAATSGGPLYYSSSYGATWRQLSPPGFYTWTSVALNATGELVLTASIDGGVWLSFDSGALWNLTTLSASLLWQGVATDRSGSRIAAIASGNAGQGGIYASASYGVRWTQAAVTEAATTCAAGYIVAGVLCVPCAAGSTAPAGTSTSCTPCAPGSYASVAGAAYCLTCPLNTYAAHAGATSCTSCAAGSVTDDTGATRAADCRNSGGVIVLGLVCLVLSALLVNVYLCYGRLSRVSLFRKRHLVQPSLHRLAQAQLSSDLLVALDSFLATALQSASLQALAAGRAVVFVCAAVVAMFVSVLGALVYGLAHLLFVSLVLYRGYATYVDLPRDFREVVRRLFDAFGVRGVAYPFVAVGGALAESDVDFTAVEAACDGGLAGQYLLLYLVLVGLVLIVVRSELQVLWKLGVEPVLTRTWSHLLALSKRQDVEHAHRRVASGLYAAGAATATLLLYLVPAPRKWVQFALGYVYVFRFFDTDGRHRSNDNCSDADTLLAVVTSAYVYALLLPALVLLAVYVLPGFGHRLPPIASNMAPPAATGAATSLDHVAAGSASDFDASYVQFSERPSLHQPPTPSKAAEAEAEADPAGCLATVNRHLDGVYALCSVVGGADWFVAHGTTTFLREAVFVPQMHALITVFAAAAAAPLSSPSAVASVAARGAGPARVMQHVQDEARTAPKMFVPRVAWLGMLRPYEPPAALRTEAETHYAQRFTWAKDHNAGMTFTLMVMEVRACLAAVLRTSPTSWTYALVVKPLSYVVFCQLCTQYGRVFWGHVLRAYALYAGVSLGVWTNATVDAYDVLHDYLRFQRLVYAVAAPHHGVAAASSERGSDASGSDASSYYEPRGTATTLGTAATSVDGSDVVAQIAAEHQRFHRLQHSAGDALQRAVYDDLPGAFQRYLFAVQSPRLALLQLVPAFTVWAVFAVELHARLPLFVFSPRLRALLPPLWDTGAFARARQLLVDEYHFWHSRGAARPTGGEPASATASVDSTLDIGDAVLVTPVRAWEVYALGVYLWARRSRLVEYFVVLMLTAAGCAVVFSGDVHRSDDDAVGSTDDGAGENDAVLGLLGFCIFLLVASGLCHSLVYLLRLHRWLFPRYRRSLAAGDAALSDGGGGGSRGGSEATVGYATTSSSIASTVNPMLAATAAAAVGAAAVAIAEPVDEKAAYASPSAV